MPNLPISPQTFQRSFLGGDGQLEIRSDQDAWDKLIAGNLPFDRTVGPIAEIDLSLGSQPELKLGRADTLKLGVSASGEAVRQIQLIWPESAVDAGLKRGLQPASSELLVRLFMQGRADASAQGSVPIGPLKTNFGVSAGGSAAFERLRIYPAAKPAGEILGDLFTGVRLPQQIDSSNEIPAAGEVLALQFSGYLKLAGNVSYGYSITGSKDIAIGKLNLDLDYALKVSAGLSAAYSLAGDFEIEARAGSSPGFVRFAIRKSRAAQFNFAADFGVDADLHLKGLPDSADEFLLKAFGAHAERALKLFDKAGTYTDLDQLEKAAGKLLKKTIHDLAQNLIGKTLTNATLDEFLTQARKFLDTYNNIDTRIIHLFEDSLQQIPKLTSTLDQISGAGSREALKAITDDQAWTLINRLAGDKLYGILLEDAPFADFSKLIGDARDFLTGAGTREIREFVQSFKAAFPLDSLLGQLTSITTADQLKNLADEKLQGIAEQILGKSFDQIRSGDVGKAVKEIHAAVEKIDQFKKIYYEKLKAVVNRSYAAQLHLAFTRANSQAALLDVEVDVSTPEGGDLARMASGGDFSKLLRHYSSKLVRIHQGVFTHEVAASTQVQINLFGYGVEGFTRVLQNTEEALEPHEGGLVHVYTTRSQIEERRKHGGELSASTFLFATVANAFQPAGAQNYWIKTLPKMSVQYDLLHEDDNTSPEELRQILDLAGLIGMLPDPAGFILELSKEFPDGLGKVSAKYVVRYESEAVAAAFQLQDTAIRERIVRQTMRHFIAARYIGMRPIDWAPRLGFAYRENATFDAFARLGFAAFANSHITVSLPLWFTKGPSQKVELQTIQKQALITLYNVEQTFQDRLKKLYEAIDGLRNQNRAITSEGLNKYVKAFIEMADDLDQFRENAFFAVFDRLVMEGSGGKALRSSALMLEITPPGGDKVTKVLTAAPPSSRTTFPT